MLTHSGAIDTWAQPANGLLRQRMPEVVRLFEKSASGHRLDQTLSRCMAQVKELGLSAEVEAKFLHGNARRVFKL